MKIFQKSVIAIIVGVAMYLGYLLAFKSIPELLISPPELEHVMLPIVAAYVALWMNDLFDIIKKK